MTSRRQDLRIRWQMAHIDGDEERCAQIENIIKEKLKTSDSLLKELGNWAIQNPKKTNRSDES